MCYASGTYWIPAFTPRVKCPYRVHFLTLFGRAGMTMLQLIRASLNENSVYVPDDTHMVKTLSHAAAEIFLRLRV